MRHEIDHETGRDYGQPQVLRIVWDDAVTTGDMIPVRFWDEARQVGGEVRLFDFEVESIALGLYVQAHYNRGWYDTRSRAEVLS